MWNLGFPEIVIIFIVALVIFGPRKLPELGRSLGRGLSEFKRASNELKRTWEDEVEAVKHEVDLEDQELKKIQTDLE
jgi:TatA/E family protein of Tat protein translocase